MVMVIITTICKFLKILNLLSLINNYNNKYVKEKRKNIYINFIKNVWSAKKKMLDLLDKVYLPYIK